MKNKTEYKAVDNVFVFPEQETVKSIKGLAASFGNIDSHGDIIVPGAFTKTIADIQSRPIGLYSSHDMDARELLGTVRSESLVQTSKGLEFEADFSSAPSSQDIAIKAKEGHLREISIGYVVIDSEMIRDEATGRRVRLLKELKVIEISLVSRASNDMALVGEVKKENQQSNENNSNNGVDEMKLTKEQIEALQAAFGGDQKPEQKSEEGKPEQKNESPANGNDSLFAELLREVKSDNEKQMTELKKEIANLKKPSGKLPGAEDSQEEKKLSDEEILEKKHEDAQDLYYDFCQGNMSKFEYKRELETKSLNSVVESDGAALTPQRTADRINEARDRINKMEDRVQKLENVGVLDLLDFDFKPVFTKHTEDAEIVEDTIADIFGKGTLNATDYAATAGMSRRLERRSFGALQPLIGKAYARAERELKDDLIMNGTGDNEPLGVVTMLQDLAVNRVLVSTGTAFSNVDYDEMADLTQTPDEEYRLGAVLYCSKNFVTRLMKIKDSQNNPLWNKTVEGNPATWNGFAVVETKALSGVDAIGNVPCVFCDLSDYLFATEKGFDIEVSTEAEFKKHRTLLKMVIAFDGIPQDVNAYAALEIKA